MIYNRFFGFLAIFTIIACSPLFAISDEAKAMIERLRANSSQVEAEATVQAESTEQAMQAESVKPIIIPTPTVTKTRVKSKPEDIFQIIATNDNNIRIELKEHIKRFPKSVNLVSKYGYTPLHGAAQTCKPEIVELLIKHGANVNAIISDGYWTPLNCASEENVEILKSAGARLGLATETTSNITIKPNTKTTSRLSNGNYTTYIGPRGGEYHYSASGKKVYHSKKKK